MVLSKFPSMDALGGGGGQLYHSGIRGRNGSTASAAGYTYGYTFFAPMLTGNFVQASQNGWGKSTPRGSSPNMKEFEVHVNSTGKEKLEHAKDYHA